MRPGDLIVGDEIEVIVSRDLPVGARGVVGWIDSLDIVHVDWADGEKHGAVDAADVVRVVRRGG